MIDFQKEVSQRFIKYTTYDTMCNEKNVGKVRPTSPGQLVLLNELKKELEALGLETYLGYESVLMGKLKANVKGIKTIGFMAHVDTADNVNGNNVKAQRLIYTGGDINLLNGVVIKESENPDLNMYLNQEIITSDGTSLLGADDKAGVACIMCALKYLVENPHIKHGDIEVYFTPDEETGSGMDMFPHDKLESVCCYTIDGGREGEIEAECFNAATLTIKIEGVGTHLGTARAKMVNAITVASQIVSAFPQSESPEATDGRLGYYCILELNATSTDAEMQLFIRDFDGDNFQRRIENAKNICSSIASLYHAKIDVNTHISYYNMAKANAELPEAMISIMQSAKNLDIDAYEEIIRGGTDGARLAHKGTPCPNLFAGGHNFHSLEEWVGVPTMSKTVNLVLEIVNYWLDK